METYDSYGVMHNYQELWHLYKNWSPLFSPVDPSLPPRPLITISSDWNYQWLYDASQTVAEVAKLLKCQNKSKLLLFQMRTEQTIKCILCLWYEQESMYNTVHCMLPSESQHAIMASYKHHGHSLYTCNTKGIYLIHLCISKLNSQLLSVLSLQSYVNNLKQDYFFFTLKQHWNNVVKDQKCIWIFWIFSSLFDI